MKTRLYCLVILLFMASVSFAETKYVIDERIELTCVVFRLAGYEEYSSDIAEAYVDDINLYFEKYKTHPLIKYAKELRVEKEVAYNSAIITSNFFQIEKKRILFKPDIDINKYHKEISPWTYDSLKKYITLLDEFYQESNFNAFFKAHEAMYEKTKAAVAAIVPELKSEWFREYWGRELKDVRLYIGPSLGVHNYGMAIPEFEHIDIIIGCSSCVNDIPMIDNLAKSVIVHEVMHSYSTPVFYKYKADLHVDELYNAFESDLYNKAHYGDGFTMAAEWINNLFTNLYIIENRSADWPRYEVAFNEDKGFVWSNRSISFMKNFYSNRDIYPTFNEFYPQLIGFLNNLVPEIDVLKKEFELRRPYVVYAHPTPGSIVDKNLKEIRFTFSQPMNVKAEGISKSQGFRYLKREQCEWVDNKNFVIHVDSLSPNTEYEISLAHNFFIGMSGHRLKEDFSVTFKTAE